MPDNQNDRMPSAPPAPLGLNPPDEARWNELIKLYARIDERVDGMMAAGLLDEVRGLVERGYGWEFPAMSSLGFFQL